MSCSTPSSGERAHLPSCAHGIECFAGKIARFACGCARGSHLRRRHYLSSPDKSSAQVLKVQAMQQRAATRVADQYDTIAAGMTMEELLQWVPPGGPLPANLEEAAVRADAADGIDDLKAARTNSWGKEGKGRWSGGGGAATGAGEEDDDIELSDGWQDRMVTGERVLDQAGDRHLEGLSDMSDLENLEEDVRRARAMAGPL